MQHFSIPTCYFPSTALFVDDNRDFLLNFILQLDEGLAYRVFDSPFDALECIQKKRCDLDVVSRRCLNESMENLTAISAEIYNPRRFSEISVVVVDYAMPGMDGLEFCRRIKDTNIRKILLTGKADEKLAVEAFNQGLIDRYIQKSDVNAAELIANSIYELQWQYFQSMSDMIVRTLPIKLPNCINDGCFADFFKQFCQEKRIVEFYLADHSGSFLLLDDDANVSFLVIKNEEELRLYADLAREKGASDELVDELIRGEKIPCSWQENTIKAEWIEGGIGLVAAHRLVGNETYFYSHLLGPVLFDISQDRLRSYHSHLEEIDAEELLTP